MSFEERLVAAVKRKREREALSLRALSNVVGVSFSSLARIERGDGAPDNNSKIRLLEWLGVEAEDEGLSFDDVAFVHFRAPKHVSSATMQNLSYAGTSIKHASASASDERPERSMERQQEHPESGPLSKTDLESISETFRRDLGLRESDPLEPLDLVVDDVELVKLTETEILGASVVNHLSKKAASEWSAMSIPIDERHNRWVILLNDTHNIERQRVTLLEEIWHILQGHKLTKIAKIGGAYGRTYDSAAEHDAYYLAAASLLPRSEMVKSIENKLSSIQTGKKFGASPQLVDYRMKRLGLWRDHVGKKVALVKQPK